MEPGAHDTIRLRYIEEMNYLPLLAIVLLILWVVARVVLAITGLFLHLLWIVAVVLFVIWLVRKMVR